MANAFNACHLIGRIPTHENFKVIYTPEGDGKRARFNAPLGVKKSYKKEGEQYYGEDIINITAFAGTADYFNKYVNRGDVIAVSGSIDVSSSFGQDGVRRTYTSVIVDSVRIISSVNDNKQQNGRQQETFQQHQHQQEEPQQDIPQQSENGRFNPFSRSKGNGNS